MIKEYKANLNKVEDAKKFTEIANNFDIDISVKNVQRKFEVDAKSIMGIFSLDLSEPVLICVEDNKEGILFLEQIWQFLI